MNKIFEIAKHILVEIKIKFVSNSKHVSNKFGSVNFTIK